MIKILVTGSNGQLGSELKELSMSSYFDFFFTDINELNITSKKEIDQYTDKIQPDFIINCAAYTNVDQAEDEKEKAFLINSKAVQNIAEICAKKNIFPIHISTDYVFSGKNHLAYTEEEETAPIGTYGASKLEGEKYLAELCTKHIIIRTSWLYSPFGKNFLKTMLKLGASKPSMNVVVDQIGTPTYARDLAKAILQIIKKILIDSNSDNWGIYHYSNEGVCSWFDFAKKIQEIAQNKCKILSIESKDYPTKAKRPNFSVLNKSKIKHIFDIPIPYWEESVKSCIARIKDKNSKE